MSENSEEYTKERLQKGALFWVGLNTGFDDVFYSREGFHLEVHRRGYDALFPEMEKLSKEKISWMIESDFAGNFEIRGFHNNTTLGKHLARILKIDWFNPKGEYRSEQFQPVVDEICDRFGMPRLKATVEKEFPQESCYSDFNGRAEAKKAIDEVIELKFFRSSDWKYELATTRMLASDAALNGLKKNERDELIIPTRYAVEDAAQCPAYSLARDSWTLRKAYKKNPFASLLTVYEAGLWPAGPRNGDFVIWHPGVKSEKNK
jgi:hypothetical protein